MKLLLLLCVLASPVWASCTVVQVSDTHRDVSCTGNSARRAPHTITTYVTVPYPSPESREGYYPSRATAIVAGGERTPLPQSHSYGWGAGGAGRSYYGGRR